MAPSEPRKTTTPADWVRSSSAEITPEFHALDDIADLGVAALTDAWMPGSVVSNLIKSFRLKVLSKVSVKPVQSSWFDGDNSHISEQDVAGRIDVSVGSVVA